VPDNLANDAIEGAWAAFSRPEYFTTSGNLSRLMFEQLAVRTLARDGEFLFELVRGADNPFRFTVRPINPDYLDEDKNMVQRDGTLVRLGVQKTAAGKPVAYWLRTWNPGDEIGWAGGRRQSVPIDATRVRHVFIPDDFELSRGVPWIHAGAARLKMLAGYEEGALEAARSAACKHEYLLEKPSENAPPPEYSGDATDSDGNPLADIEPGMRERLPAGLEPFLIDPSYPHAEHRPFIQATLMGVAAGLNMSYSALTGDLTQANYSSIRAGLLPERDMWMVLQRFFIDMVERPIFEAWLEMALLAGAVRQKGGSALPAAKFAKFNQPVFQGRRWPWVDPLKDQQANETALRNSLSTHSKIVEEQGGDFEELCRQIQRDRETAARYGIDIEPVPLPGQPGKEPMPEPDDDEPSAPPKPRKPQTPARK
jgi:lambda family phage portal protein